MFRAIKTSSRHFSSALYITGDKAQTNFALLTPFIDFDEQLKHKEQLVENAKTRQLPIDIDKVEERWNYFKELEAKKNVLEQTRAEIGKKLSNLSKMQADSKEINKLEMHLKIVKEDLKNLRDVSYSIEEGAVLKVLGLPNVLHPKTPQSTELELYSYLEKNNRKSEDHLKIGTEKGYLKFINPMSCYLKGDAAIFEHSIQNYFSDKLVNLSYLQFSNSDFVKTIVVEGCGLEPSSISEVFTLEDIHCIKGDSLNKLHLVGASSLYSFMAYFTKHSVQAPQFPVKAFCVGRTYRTNCSNSLFNLNQSSEVGLFIASMENSDLLQAILSDITTLYQQLGLHFRVVLIPANKLKKAESLRLSMQMFSNHLLSYIEVGSVSFYQDYLSKRLLFNYGENKERKFPYVIGGNLINIHKVLGCVIENSAVEENKPFLNDFLLSYVC